jgi:hypothetical protein
MKNKIGDIGSKYIGSGLCKLVKLNKLDLYVARNSLGDIGIKYLA